MRIANPIYDVVFKYLMEDIDIARLLLSEIIGEDIVEIEFKAKENTGRSEKFLIIIFRLDFKAVIRTKDGRLKKVLIELQKGKEPGDILRFRKYLGENYRKPDEVFENGVKVQKSLPIITIYFLGFSLKTIRTPVIKVNRDYIDLRTSEKINVREDFIEKLSHDSFIIQITRLTQSVQSELERILQVFNQTYISDDDEKILILDNDLVKENELLNMMAERLRRAATEEEIFNQIELVEEVENRIESYIRKNQEALDQAQKMEALAEDMETKAKDMEAKAKDMEAKAKDMEAKAKDMETKAKDMETKAKDMETKAKDMETKAKDMEAKAEDMETKAKDMEAKAEKLEAKNLALKKEIDRLKDQDKK